MNFLRKDSQPSKDARPQPKPVRREERDDDDDAPKKRGPRRRLSLEMKLGVAFVGALLTVFCVVLGVRLAGAGKDEPKVELNLGSPTEPPAKAPATALAKAPQPTIVTERTTTPAMSPPPAFASRPPATPPTVTSPTANPPAMTMSPPGATVAAASPSFAGDRYAATTTTATTATTGTNTLGSSLTMTTGTTSLVSSTAATWPNTAVTGTTSIAGFSTVATDSGNPLRAAPTTSATATGNSPYGVVATPTSPYAAAASVTGTGLSNVGSISTTPTTPAVSATMVPRPFDAATTVPPPIARDRGVAAIGATTGLAAPSNTLPVAAAPIAAPAPAITTPAVSAPAAFPLDVSAAPVAAVRPYVVAPNDSFWSIAEKMYGDGSYYRALYAFNSDRYPHAEDVRTGSVIDVPPTNVLKAKFPELVGADGGAVPAGGESPAMTGRAGVPVAARTYVVQEGDTLFDIARRQLGKASYWSEIYNLNRAVLGENLERLQPGTELMLPDIQTTSNVAR
jgi:nucleoid-associated protein YgaU